MDDGAAGLDRPGLPSCAGPTRRLPALHRAHRSGPTADFDVGIAGSPTTTSDGTTQDGRPGCEYGPVSGPARGSARSRSARWIHPRGDRELGVPTPARPGLRLITAGSAVPTEGRRLQLRGVPAVQPGRRFSDEMASAGPGTNRPFLTNRRVATVHHRPRSSALRPQRIRDYLHSAGRVGVHHPSQARHRAGAPAACDRRGAISPITRRPASPGSSSSRPRACRQQKRQALSP